MANNLPDRKSGNTQTYPDTRQYATVTSGTGSCKRYLPRFAFPGTIALLVTLLALAATLPARAAGETAPDKPGSPENFMPADQVRRGMEGYGLTVFQGTKVERFSVKILGVLRKTGADSDLILARLSGGPLAKTGMIAGMSGSPVYINGKLVGAIAYAWGFAKETMAGITPIHEMYRIFGMGKSGKAPEFRMKPQGKTSLHGHEYSDSGSLRPVATPLIISGVKPGIFSFYEQEFEKLGFLPILGGGAGAAINTPAATNLEPGSAVGVRLVSGDMNVTGIGTVTYTGPEGILAFGHPMMMRGNSSFPMTSAYIHTVMPSQQISFKLGAALKEIGMIHQDRQPAIAGQMNKQAPRVPVSVGFSIGKKRKKEYAFQIVEDRQLFSRLLAMTMLKTLTEQSASGDTVSYTIDYRFSIVEEDSGEEHTVHIRDAYAAFQSAKAYQASLKDMVSQIEAALYNSFETVRIKNVSVTVSGSPEIRAVEITDLKCDHKKVKPGDRIQLRVELTPYQGEAFWKNVSIKVPERTVNGKIFFVVSSRAHERYYDYFFAPAKYQPTNLKQMVKILNFDRNAADLVVWSELYETGLVVNGRALPNLPASHFRMLSESQAKQLGTLNARLRRIYKTNYYLYGLKVVMLDMDYSAFD